MKSHTTLLSTRLVRVAVLASLLLYVGCGSDSAPETDASTGDAASLDGSANGAGGKSASPGDPAHPVVQIKTSLGEITVKLDAEKAPATVRNFLGYAANGFYTDTVFHQVSENYIALGGGYTKDLEEKKAYLTIRNEADNQLSNRRGTIAMARNSDTIDSSKSMFFFNLNDNQDLDYTNDESAENFGYCVFGEVIQGQEVLDKMSKVLVADRKDLASVPVEAITIDSVILLR